MARNGKTDRHEIPSNRLHALYAASGGALSMDVIAADSLPADVKECDFSVEGGESFRFESLVIDLAAGFINVDPEDVDHAIENCLRRGPRCAGLRLDESGTHLGARGARSTPHGGAHGRRRARPPAHRA